MKRLIFSFCLLATSIAFAQNSNVENNAAQTINTVLGAANNGYGSSFKFNNPRRATIGTYYLFDKWDNYAQIVTTDGKTYSIRNLNLNIRQNSFESKVDSENIFVFNFNNIQKFIINNKAYKKFFSQEGGKVYQIIYEHTDYTILKGFDVELIEGSANPMVNRKNDKYVRKDYYAIKKGDEIKRMRLRKKNIVKLIGQKKQNEILDYAKTQELSFKKEIDVKKILDHFNAK